MVLEHLCKIMAGPIHFNKGNEKCTRIASILYNKVEKMNKSPTSKPIQMHLQFKPFQWNSKHKCVNRSYAHNCMRTKLLSFFSFFCVEGWNLNGWYTLDIHKKKTITQCLWMPPYIIYRVVEYYACHYTLSIQINGCALEFDSIWQTTRVIGMSIWILYVYVCVCEHGFHILMNVWFSCMLKGWRNILLFHWHMKDWLTVAN